MGERTEFQAQTNSTDWIRFGDAPSPTRLALPRQDRRSLHRFKAAHGSAPPMQGENEREDASGGVEIDFDLALQPLLQEFGGLVVEPAPAHVDGLDLGGRSAADRLVI